MNIKRKSLRFWLVRGTALALLFIAIGSYSGRKVRDIDDYFVAGRRAPTLLIVGTLVASVFSTSIFLGEAGFTYDGQMGAYILLPGIALQSDPDFTLHVVLGQDFPDELLEPAIRLFRTITDLILQ